MPYSKVKQRDYVEKANASYKPAREWIGVQPRSRSEERTFEIIAQAQRTVAPIVQRGLDAEHVSGELMQMRLRR